MEKWNKICYYLSEKIKTNILEKEFEPIVEKGLEILGWSEYSGDFDIRPSIQLGSRKNRLQPDFLVKSNENGRKLFVVEIKRPKILLKNQDQIQLSTYMRQYKLEFGLLIGSQIQIFYDGELNKKDTAILIENIEYKKDNKKGLNFVQLFQKENFSKNKLKDFIHLKFVEFENKIKEKELKNELLDATQDVLIKEIFKPILLKKYKESVIDNVFKTLETQVRDTSKYKDGNKQNTKGLTKNSKGINQLSTKIKKKKALEILNNKSLEVNNQNVVFSNMVKPHDNWWIDFNPNNFEKKFYIVLNDYKEKVLFVFEIPAKTFYPPEKYFYYRKDIDRYSIGILGIDKREFKDTKYTKNLVCFKRFLKHEIEYKEVGNIPNKETKKAIYEANHSKKLKPIEDLDEYFENL